MKIACESCGAKYSIADEKVAGKVFKIRCKRCSEVIVVRGDQQGGAGAAAAGASASPAGGGEPIWHVVINGDQAGPYAPDQLSEMLSNGTIDWEAYVWAEGFDNWVPMREVEALVSQISGGGAAQSAPAAEARLSAYEAQSDAFSAQPSMGADPFADEPPTTAHQGYGAASVAEPDLFGGGGRAQAASPFDGGHVVASSPSPRTGGGAAAVAAATPAAEAMTGARNENSVLFSLKNLQALATGSGGAPSMPAAAPGQERQGYAGGEGSGLIDIRALASATGVGESDSKDSKDELLSIGNQGAFGALGSPMLAPASDDDSGKGKMIIWALVAGVGMVSIAVVAVVYIMTSSAPQQVAEIKPGAAPPVIVEPPKPAEAEPAEELSEGEKAAKDAAEKAAEDQRASDTKSGESRRPRSGSSSGSSSSSASEEKAPAAAPDDPKTPPKPSGPRTIDDLLDGALGGGGTKTPKPAAAAAPSNLPQLPAKEQVMAAMSGVKGAVSACGGTGVATVTVNVAGATGRVTSAEVAGVTGPAGSCIAKAVRGANFPKFQQKVFTVKYPFKL